MKVKLIKIYRDSTIQGGLRTTEVIGVCNDLPKINKKFCMVSEPLEYGNIRVIETSLITNIELDKELNQYIVNTESGSIYKITVL